MYPYVKWIKTAKMPGFSLDSALSSSLETLVFTLTTQEKLTHAPVPRPWWRLLMGETSF